MKAPLRRLILVTVLAAAALVAVRVFSPTRGVQRRWDALIAASESHDAAKLSALIADEYADGWSLKKANAVNLAEGIFRQFLTVSIQREQPALTLAPDGTTATSSAVIRVQGMGGPVATLVTSGTAKLNTPTVFHWRRMSWKPWDWQLTRIENQDLKQDLRSLEKEVTRPGSSL